MIMDSIKKRGYFF